MNPGAAVWVTVMLAETACAVAGIPQKPAIGKMRMAPPISAGGPKGPVNPPEGRVSARRQGGMATNAMGGVGSVSTSDGSAAGSGTPCAQAPGAPARTSIASNPDVLMASPPDTRGPAAP